MCYKNAHCISGDSQSYTLIDKNSDKCIVDTTRDYCTLPGYIVDWKENKSTKAHPNASDPGNKNICYEKNEPYCSGNDPSRYFDENIYDGKCAENLQNRCNYQSGKYSWDEDVLKCLAKPDCPNSGSFIESTDRCRLDINCHDGLYTGTDTSLNVCFTKDRSGNGYVPDGANTVKGLGYDNYDSCPNGSYSKTDNVCNGGRDVCDNKSWSIDNSVDTCYTSYSCPGESYFKNLGDGSSEAKKDKCYEYKDKVCKRYKLNGNSYFHNSSQDRCEYNNPYCSGSDKSINMEKGNIDKCTETPRFICDTSNGYAHIVREDFTDKWGAHNRCEKAKDCLGGNFDDVVNYDSNPDKDLCYMDRVIECDSKNNYVPEYYKGGEYPDGADTNDYGDICKWTGDLDTLCKNGKYNGDDKFNVCDAGQDVCKEYRLKPIFSIDKCVQNVSCGMDDQSGNWFDSVKDMCYHDTYTDTCDAQASRSGVEFVLNWSKSNTTAPHKAHWSVKETKNTCYENTIPECKGNDKSVAYSQNTNTKADGRYYEGICTENWKNDCPKGYKWVDSLDKCIKKPDCPNSGSFDESNDRCKIGVSCSYGGAPALYNKQEGDGQSGVCYTGKSDGTGYVPDGDNIPEGLPQYDSCPNGSYNGKDGFNVCDAGEDVCDYKDWVLDKAVDTCYTSYSCPGESYFKELGNGSIEAKKDKCYEYKDKVCRRFKVDGRVYIYDPKDDRCENSKPYCSGSSSTIRFEYGGVDMCTETPNYSCDKGYAYKVRSAYTHPKYDNNRCEKAKDCLGGNFDDVVNYDSNPDKDLCYMDRVIECDSKNNYVPEYYKGGEYPDGADTNDYGDICKWTGDLDTLCKNGKYNGDDKFNVCDAGQDVCKGYRLTPEFSTDLCIQKVSCGSDDIYGSWFDTKDKMCYHDTYVDVCNAASTRDGIQFVLNWAKSNTTAPHKAHWSEPVTKNVCYEDSVPECRGKDASVKYDQNIVATADGKKYEGLCTEDWKNDCPKGYDWVDILDKCVDKPDCPNGGQFDENNDRCKVAIGCNYNGSPKLYNSLEVKGKDSVCYTGLTENGQGYVPDGDNIPDGMPIYDSCPNGSYNADDRFNVCDAGQNVCKGLNKDFSEDKCYVYPYCGVNDPVVNPNKFDPYGKDFYNKELDRCVSGVYVNCQGGIGINPKTGKMENCDIKEEWCTPFEYVYDEELCIATNVSCGTNQYDEKNNRCFYYAKEVGCRTDLGYILEQPDPTDQSKDECYIQDIKKMTEVCKNKDNFVSINTLYDENLTRHEDYNSTVIKEHVIFSRLYNACATGWDENASRGYLGHVCPEPDSFGYVFKFRKYVNIDGTPPKEGVTDKCMMAPICHDGVWNPNNNGCYLGDFTCPLGPEYECRKMSETPLPDPNDPNSFIEDRWCSPIDCHNRRCRVAKCDNQPKQDPKHLDWCFAKECDGYEPYTQCGQFECPSDAIKKMFGDKFKCYKLVCPDNSIIENGKCYQMKCPSDAIEENGKCYRD